jgi:glucose-1-phosphate adenylyltransferase
VLNTYIGIGAPWDLDRKHGGVTVLPPFVEQGGGDWYKGTANAIYRNIGFIEQYNPEYVLVISGDHIYKMDYDLMLDFHKSKEADATIAVIEVKWEETSRFGIMSVDDQNAITQFAEKPKEAQSNLASMGVYIFNWSVLKAYLIQDELNPNSSKDFGKDIIPQMLRDQVSLFAYPFQGYWKDVGTIESLWEANMDLLDTESELDLGDADWRIYSLNPYQPPHYVSMTATVKRSLVNEGCSVFGDVDHSVLFYGVQVADGSIIRDSVIMPNVKIGSNVVIRKAIIGEGSVIEDGAQIGDGQEIVLIGSNSQVSKAITSNVKG